MTEIHFVLQILSHVQPLNARFYPINKSDFFPGCNFHSMKISNVLLSQCNNKRRHFVICMQCLRSERNMAINLRKCFKQKIPWFWRWIWKLFHPWDSFFYNIFTLVSHSWKSCLTSEINSIFNVKPFTFTRIISAKLGWLWKRFFANATSLFFGERSEFIRPKTFLCALFG